jgi:hypothetical protein
MENSYGKTDYQVGTSLNGVALSDHGGRSKRGEIQCYLIAAFAASVAFILRQ